MSEIKLKPCPRCKRSNIKIETWASGGRMYMIKCNNPDCPVPESGYPTGRNLDELKETWNRREGEQNEKVNMSALWKSAGNA